MVVMGLDLAWCCLRFEHCSQKASQSCGWNMDTNGFDDNGFDDKGWNL